MTLQPQVPVAGARVAAPADRAAILAIAQASGMFDPDHATALANMLDEWFAGGLDGHVWVVHDRAPGGVTAVAYVMPELMTQGTWNLQFIAVDPDHQSAGEGSSLVSWIEGHLSFNAGRVLIVETSSLAEYETARAFYDSHGFDEEARIRDFYAAGEDKIVFRKALAD